MFTFFISFDNWGEHSLTFLTRDFHDLITFFKTLDFSLDTCECENRNTHHGGLGCLYAFQYPWFFS
jgi:hypothetical protein